MQLSRFSNRLTVLTNSHSNDIELHALLCTPGATPEVQLAKDLGGPVHQRRIDTDIEQQSNVPGVHAAGDVPRIHGPRSRCGARRGDGLVRGQLLPLPGRAERGRAPRGGVPRCVTLSI